MTTARPAIVTLRMTHALRDALHSAASQTGCSLNAYALQILASAAGDAGRFRAARAELPDDPRDVERDEHGFPLEWRLRCEHGSARQDFFEAMAAETDETSARRLVDRYDRENPAHFVEWQRLREAAR